MRDKSILFYDGECGLCSKAVLFMLKNERNSNLYFCSLQSVFAKQFLAEFSINTSVLSTLYLYHNGAISQKSSAALKLLSFLKKRFFPFYLAYVFPRFLRDFWYDLIAKNRKRFFKNSCELLKVDADRFLN
jgi:predicted DCC family thiol-disulfide oxidoreductase YuxK